MSMFADFGRRIIKARHKQAQRQVNAVLLTLDDETLRKAGYKREDLADGYHGSVYL